MLLGACGYIRPHAVSTAWGGQRRRESDFIELVL